MMTALDRATVQQMIDAALYYFGDRRKRRKTEGPPLAQGVVYAAFRNEIERRMRDEGAKNK